MQQHCKLRGRGSEVSVSWNTGWNINNDKHLQLLWVMFMERPCGPILGNDAMLGFPVAPLPMMKNKHGTVTMVSMALWLWPSWHCGYGLHGTVVMAFMALWL